MENTLLIGQNQSRAEMQAGIDKNKEYVSYASASGTNAQDVVNGKPLLVKVLKFQFGAPPPNSTDGKSRIYAIGEALPNQGKYSGLKFRFGIDEFSWETIEDGSLCTIIKKFTAAGTMGNTNDVHFMQLVKIHASNAPVGTEADIKALIEQA